MKTPLLIVGLLLAACAVWAQDFSGEWEGWLVQEGKADTFRYALQLAQAGQGVSGTARAETMDGRHAARFQVTGLWDGAQLVLQEVAQLSPQSPAWCMKYATLDCSADGQRLSGPWRADGCTPGQMSLHRPGAPHVGQEAVEGIEGQWSGALSQSDRGYGFYIALNLKADGQGVSYIVSEGSGGSAKMALSYTFDAVSGVLQFEESKVVEREDPDWPWCIKSGSLRFRKEENRLVLDGGWKGFIEGYNLETGPCASGSLYLERALLNPEAVQVQQAVSRPYESDNQRAIKVQRVVEVAGPNLKIKIWDNGTVDGDVATLFLNGERILHQYRVSKRRIAIPVTLSQPSNFLVLHADDLGDIRPNTVAVAIDDGVREQTIIVSSNLEESGALMIRQFKVE